MKLWRKQSMTAGKRSGRQIKRAAQMQEMIMQNSPKTYPLLDSLFKRAGMAYSLSKRQQETLQRMIEESNANATEEIVDETK